MYPPAIDGLDKQGGARQPVTSGKRVDPGQRQRRNGKIDLSHPKIVGHIDGSEEQCIAALDRVGRSGNGNSLISLQQALYVKRKRLPRSRNYMLDRPRHYRARGKVGKRCYVAGVAVSFYNRDKGRHLQLAVWQKEVIGLRHFARPRVTPIPILWAWQSSALCTFCPVLPRDPVSFAGAELPAA